MFLLLYRLVRAILMTKGVIPNSQMEGVVMGKFTAQVPGADGSPPSKASEQDVVAILLAARSNQSVPPCPAVRSLMEMLIISLWHSPLGLFGKGFKEVSIHQSSMVAELNEHGEKYGCKYPPSRLSFQTSLTINDLQSSATVPGWATSGTPTTKS